MPIDRLTSVNDFLFYYHVFIVIAEESIETQLKDEKDEKGG